MKQFLILLLVVLVAAFFSAFIFFHYYLNADRIGNYASELAGEKYQVHIEGVSLKLFSRTAEFRGLSIQTTDKQDLFTADLILFEGIGVIEAIRGNVWVRRVIANDFFLNQKLFPDEVGSGSDKENEFAILLGEVVLQDGKVSFMTGDDGTGDILGLNVNLGFVTKKFGCSDCEDNLEIGNIDVEIAEINYKFWENRYELGIQFITINEVDSFAEMGSIYLKSTLSTEDFFESLNYRTDHFFADLSGLEIQNLDFSQIKKGERFSSSYISVDSLDLHVTLDKRVPRNPEKQNPPMPLEALANTPIPIFIDSLFVSHADIRYSEIDEEGARPGTITFARTSINISAIYSDLSAPVVVTARSFLENAGEINTEFRFDMEEDVSITRIKGSVGRFNITLLNNILEDLEGIRINDGTIYRSDFIYTMRGKNASGFFEVHYDNLSIEQINRVDHDQGFRNRLASFFMDQIAMRSSSQHNGEDFRRGEIDEEQVPEKGFFNFVWISLRSGMMDAVSRL
jgi:hypothetical protein